MSELRTWADSIEIGPSTVSPGHVPTPIEINNLVYLCFKYVINCGMRQADLAVVQMMGGEVTSVEQLDEKFLPALAEYMWDHHLGEPEEILQEDVLYACKKVKALLFSMDEVARNSL
jgi:hypothetical protein